ncbi:MAG: ubiquinol-cytochrome c reductase iron-sulfur subunit [candidate division WOR-3 bacterium]
MDRRKFIAYLGRSAVVLTFLGQGFAYFRSLVPNTLYEPSKKFLIGYPKDYPEGITFVAKHRLFVVREGKSFWVISAICQHLGCTVNIVPPKQEIIKVKGQELVQKWEFFCPCHGSQYYVDGSIYAGPAPRGLPWYKVDIGPNGQLVVDTNTEVDHKFRLIVENI